MPRVAIVTDSAADLDAQQVAQAGIRVVPLLVSFGSEDFRIGVDITTEGFYDRLLAPGAPFPSTAACSPAAFEEAFREELEGGADAIVCLTIGSRLSATFESARLARQALPEAAIHLVDCETTSMSQGFLALAGARAAADGQDPEVVVATIEELKRRSRVYLALDTLEWLRRGGRISAAQAAIGGLLAVKPIITVEGGLVETADRPRTATRARTRLLELLARRPAERAFVLHTRAPAVEAFADELAARLGLARENVGVGLIGPAVGSHVGPRAYGAAIITAPGA